MNRDSDINDTFATSDAGELIDTLAEFGIIAKDASGGFGDFAEALDKIDNRYYTSSEFDANSKELDLFLEEFNIKQGGVRK